MYNDLMLFYSLFVVFVLLRNSVGQQTTVYVQRGDTAELCDDRPTSIYAYEYRSFDGKKVSILETTKQERFSNPHQTSLLRINNVTESDSGLYKCPQDDTEWQKLQVYMPVRHVHLSNLNGLSRVHSNDYCGSDNSNCLALIEGDPLDVACAADGSPPPTLAISLDQNGTKPSIMALVKGHAVPTMINGQFQPSVYETYRIVGLKPSDNGRNITCQAHMKEIDQNLILTSTKQLYIEFRPAVIEKSKKIYCGINQTRTVNCTVQHANPTYIRYAVNGLSPFVIRRTYGEPHDFQYTFDITPTSIDQFHPFNITANNSVGFDTCTYDLIHGGVPDPITECKVDSETSNTTITISCLKSYAQGDNDGYACTLFEYNEKGNQKMFEEIARTKSCIFALENFHEPVEFRVAAFNRYGSLPVNTYGYIIRRNQPTISKETPFMSRKTLLIVGCVSGGLLLLLFICCVCATCPRDQTKYPSKAEYDQKNKYPHSTNENEPLKSITDDTISHLVPSGNEKRVPQNGTVYDIPSHLHNGNHSQETSAYHQQKPHQSSNINYIDRDSVTSSVNSIPTRTRLVNNKFYGHPVVDSRYGPLSPTTMVVPTTKRNSEHDEEEGDESPVYSTTTDILSESGSFLVPSSSKRYAPPHPKPRYSTLSSVRLPFGNLERTPLPLPKPRSRSNSRTRLNNPNFDNSSLLYEERPVSSSDSGMGQSDVVCLPNGDTIRSGLVKSGQDNLQKQQTIPSTLQQQARNQTLASLVPRGTAC